MARDIHIKLASVGLNNEGTPWDDGGHQKIEAIFISYSTGGQAHISSMQVVYSDGSDRVLSPCHGASGGSSYSMITITEPITRIYGTLSKYAGGITSLQLSNRQGRFYEFGVASSGTTFTFHSDSGFSGFHGRADNNYLKALGVYVNNTARSHLNS